MALMALPDNSDAAKESVPFEEDVYVGPIEEKTNTNKPTYISNPKKSPGRKLLQSFIQNDAQTIGDFVLYDIIIPKIKDIIFEGIDGALSRILWGDDRGNSIHRSGTRSSINYSDRYQPRYRSGYVRADEVSSRPPQNFVNNTNDPERIRVISRQEGERILEDANRYLEDYNFVSIRTLYDISHIRDDGNYMNLEYGWYSLRNAYVDKDRSGWVLKMPRPVYLGKANGYDGPRDE